MPDDLRSRGTKNQKKYIMTLQGTKRENNKERINILTYSRQVQMAISMDRHEAQQKEMLFTKESKDKVNLCKER